MGEDGTVRLMLMPTQMLLLLILSLLLLINMLCLGHWVQPYLATKGTFIEGQDDRTCHQLLGSLEGFVW